MRPSYLFSTTPPQHTVGVARIITPFHRFRRRLPCENLRRKSTGKELDRETGLYYFGARYFDPRTSRWLSPDPAIWEGDYIPRPGQGDRGLGGMGGVFRTINLHAYRYAGNNPIRYFDPDGREDVLPSWTSTTFEERFFNVEIDITDNSTRSRLIRNMHDDIGETVTTDMTIRTRVGVSESGRISVTQERSYSILDGYSETTMIQLDSSGIVRNHSHYTIPSTMRDSWNCTTGGHLFTDRITQRRGSIVPLYDRQQARIACASSRCSASNPNGRVIFIYRHYSIFQFIKSQIR